MLYVNEVRETISAFWKNVQVETGIESSMFHLDWFSHSLTEYKGELIIYGGCTWNKLAGLILPLDIVALNIKTAVPWWIDIKGTILP